MATGTLTGSTIAGTYKSLLKVTGSENEVLDASTTKVIEDGDGNPTPLKLSQDTVDINSGFELAGSAVTASATELNVMDGSATTQATVTLAGTDGVVISDGDTMKQALVSDFEVYMEANLDTMGSQFTSASALATVGTIGTGTWEATDVAVAHGGTGASTFTDGGILLGSGTSAITATAVLGDGEILIGDGTTDPVALDIGSSTAITIVGALASGSIASGFGVIDNGTSGIRTNTFTAETSIIPDASGGADIGSTSAEWGDVFIADDKKIKFGNDQDFTIEYDEDGSDIAQFAGADIGMNGKYLLNEQGRQDHVANTMPAPYYRFDGVDDDIQLGAGLTLDSDFSISVMIKPKSVTGSYICGNITHNRLYFNTATRVTIRAGSGSFLNIDHGHTFTVDDWQHFVITRENDVCKIFRNGIEGTGTQTVSADFGVRYISSLGDQGWYENSIQSFAIHNHALTATEVKELYSGASVPFKYKGANQTLILDDDCADDDTGDWTSDPSATLSFDTDHYELANTGATHGAKIQGLTVIKGKQYQLSIDIKDGTASSQPIWMSVRDDSSLVEWGTDTITTTGSFVTHTFTMDTALPNDTDAEFYLYPTGDLSGSNIEFKNVKLTQIGAVAEYDGSGASETTWYDKSGNNLDGTVTGASLENKYTAIQVDNLKLNGNTITSEDTNGNITLTPNGTGYAILNGNVGLGTTGPLKTLHVNGQGAFGDQVTASNAIRSLNLVSTDAVMRILRVHASYGAGLDIITRNTADGSDTASWHIHTDGVNKDLRFMERIGGDEVLVTFTDDGNVGIGTDSPSDKLEIYGDNPILKIRQDTLIAGNPGISIVAAGADNHSHIKLQNSYIWSSTNSSSSLEFGSVLGTPKMVINTSSGKVGIGTASPANLLALELPSAALGFTQGIKIQTNIGDSTVGRGGGITMRNYDVETAGIYGIRESGGWYGALTFYTHTSSSGNTFGTTFTEKMRITSGGKVGIGTAAPGQLLDVNSGGGNMIADGYDTHSLAVYKENIEDASGYLDKVLACPAQKWNRKPFVSANEIKEAVLEEFGEDVLIEEAVEAQDAVYETIVVQEAVEEELWAEGDDLPEDIEIGDVKTEAQEEETEEQLVSEAIEAKDAVYEKQYSVWDELFPEDNSHRQKALYNMPDGDLKTWIDDWCEAKRVEMRPENKWQKKRLGLVADAELTAEHLPEVVSINDDGEPTGIDTMTYIGILHNAVQELSAKVEALENA